MFAMTKYETNSSVVLIEKNSARYSPLNSADVIIRRQKNRAFLSIPGLQKIYSYNTLGNKRAIVTIHWQEMANCEKKQATNVRS